MHLNTRGTYLSLAPLPRRTPKAIGVGAKSQGIVTGKPANVSNDK